MALLDSQDENAERVGRAIAERSDDHKGRTAPSTRPRLPALSHHDGTAQTPARRWRAFALLAVAFFMTVVDLTIVNVAQPTIGRKLHFPE